VRTLVAHLRGESVEKRVATGEYVATAENMNTPRYHDLLYPAMFGD
jgi:hypothetical protein